MKYPLLILLALYLSFSVASCKKDDPAPVDETPVQHTPDFEYTGKQYVYSPIKFTSNFKEDTKLTWNFGNGDEETIFGKEISYTYKEAGSYTVTMTIVDSFGGTVSKGITISNGPERVSGKHNWNFFLKAGDPLAIMPTQTFSKELQLEIVNDTTIRIPDIPQLRIRGPYTVRKHEVNAKHLVYKTDDKKSELSYVFDNFTASMKIIQVHKDTVWTLTGVASIYN